MASEPRPVEPGAVDDIDFRRGLGQGPTPEEVPPVPERPQTQAEAQYDEYLRPPPVEPYPPRRSRTRAVLLGFLAVLALVGVVWFAYQWGLETGYRYEVPTIKAEVAPIKAKPENPGGLVVPDQDKLVLNQGSEGEAAPRVERLLSAPEAPQPVLRAEPPPDPAPAQAATAARVDPQASDTVEIRSGTELKTPAEPMGITGSQVVAKPAVKDPEPPVPAAPKAAAESAWAPQVAKVGEPAPAATSSSSATPSSGAPAEPSQAVSLQDLASGGGGGGGSKAAATQLAAITKGDYVIQLAAVGSTAAAQSEWQRLQRSFPDLLGDMTLSVQEVTVKGKLYHRVQTGPFPSRATAQDMCAQIKRGKQACIVQQR